MSTYEELFGRAGRPGLGVGFSMPPGTPQAPKELDFPEFGGGLVITPTKTAASMNQAIEGTDIEPTRAGALVRSPGARALETVTPHSLRNLFLHNGLDANSHLIAIDPPNVGFKQDLSTVFIWENKAVGGSVNSAWVAVNYGDTLVFSDGLALTYTRDKITRAVTDISASIVAKTFASIFGRIFAGGVFAPTYQALGIAWNGSSADPADWVGLNSGAELLIADIGAADAIVALRPLGLDALGILCQNSLWAGYPTGVDVRPADFRLRFQGYGCVDERTVQQTPGGLTFLSQSGVVNYNISDVEIISHAINDELLPQIGGPTQPPLSARGPFASAYDPLRQRYYLMTLQGMYIYEFPHEGIPARWIKRSLGGPLSLAGSFVNMITYRTNFPFQPLVYYTNTLSLYAEDPTALGNGPAPMLPYWVTPSTPDDFDAYVVTLGIYLTYSSSEVTSITLSTRDQNNATLQSVTISLPNTNGAVRERFFPLDPPLQGVGSSLQLTFGTGFNATTLEVRRLRQVILLGGPAAFTT